MITEDVRWPPAVVDARHLPEKESPVNVIGRLVRGTEKGEALPNDLAPQHGIKKTDHLVDDHPLENALLIEEGLEKIMTDRGKLSTEEKDIGNNYE